MRVHRNIDQDFVAYLNKALIDLDISENKLSKGCAVSQKSINRYRNGETNPSEDVKASIRRYIELVREEKVAAGKKYISEELREYQEMLDSVGDGTEGIVYLSERLKYYTPTAQKYIVRFLSLYLYIDEEERNFIEELNLLNPVYRKKVVGMLENQPISLEYLEKFEYEQMDIEPDTPTSKMRGYLDIISAKVDLKGNIHTKIDARTNDTGAVAIKECRKIFDSATEDYFYRTGCYVSGDIFTKIDEYLLKYTHKDWYYLYLYNRLKVMDIAEKTSKRIMNEIDFSFQTERVAMVWDYIELLKK